jgi:hypothetical protein
MAKRTSQVTITEFLVLSCLVALGTQPWMLFPNYGPAFVLLAAWLMLFLRYGFHKQVSTIAVQAFIVLLVFYVRFREGAGVNWWLTPYFLSDAAFYSLLFLLLHVVSQKLMQCIR